MVDANEVRAGGDRSRRRIVFYGPCQSWLFELNLIGRRWNVRIASHQIAVWDMRADWWRQCRLSIIPPWSRTHWPRVWMPWSAPPPPPPGFGVADPNSAQK